MPIYRVPELSSTHNFQSRHNQQPPDDRLRRHDQHHHQQQQQQQHHHHHYHREQPFLEHMQTYNSSNDEVSMKRSHSNPTRMVADAAASADESIVEREIRLQLEKEAEIASLHQDLRSGHRSPPSGHSSFRDGPEKERRDGNAVPAAAAAGHNSQGVIRDDDDDGDDDDDRRAVGHFSRVGDSTVVRELTEQKRREEELRSRYRNVGTTIRDRVENGKAPGGKTEPPGSHPSSSSSSFSSSSAGGVRSATKVQPLFDPEEDEDEEEEEDEVDFRQIYIKPQMETLMEREVRLLRQREGSLRRVRGYPLPPKEERLTEVGKAPARRPQSTDQPRGGQQPPHHSGETTGDGPNLRRLATNRLKQEMLKERQRELDLRRQGKIYTISEERVGLDPSHLAVGGDADGNGRGQSARGAASDDVVADRSTDVGHLHGVGYDAPPRHQNQQQHRRSTDSGDAAAAAAMPPWRTSAEMRIEAEVREARRREKELREQRRLMSTAPLTSPQPDQSSEEKNRSVYRRT